jgi:hypothetical protein
VFDGIRAANVNQPTAERWLVARANGDCDYIGSGGTPYALSKSTGTATCDGGVREARSHGRLTKRIRGIGSAVNEANALRPIATAQEIPVHAYGKNFHRVSHSFHLGAHRRTSVDALIVTTKGHLNYLREPALIVDGDGLAVEMGGVQGLVPEPPVVVVLGRSQAIKFGKCD